MTTRGNLNNSSKVDEIMFLNLSQLRKKINERRKQTKTEIENKNPKMSQSIPLLNLKKGQKQKPRKLTMPITPRTPRTENNPQQVYFSFTERTITPTKNPKTPTTPKGSDLRNPFSKNNQKIYQSAYVAKKKTSTFQSVTMDQTIQTVSNDFLSSFRVIFNELISNYFLQIFLKRKVKYITFQIWNYILKNANIQISSKKQNIHYQQIETKTFLYAFKNMFANDFKPRQIQDMVKKYFTVKGHVFYDDFQKIMTSENDFVDFLIQRSYEKKYNSYTPTKVVNAFFKTLIQFTDLEKKLRMIAHANEHEFIKFILSIGNQKMIKISKFAEFLDEADQYLPFGLKLTQAKLTNFLDKMLNQKHTKYQFIKWLKFDQKLLCK